MKNLLLILSLVITASPAFASRARLEALGEGKDGSYYIQDDRDIFLNPADITMYKKKLFLELGGATNAADTTGASVAQGGFINTFGDFTYGLYLDHSLDRFDNLITATKGILGGSGFSTLTMPDHTVDFFFGGETSSLKYGANVFWAGSQAESSTGAGLVTNNTASVFGVRAGVILDRLQVFTTIGILADSKTALTGQTTDADLKGKVSVDAAATYSMDDMTYFAKFTSFGADAKGGSLASGTTYTPTTMAYGIGAGWKHEASKSITMFSRVGIDFETDELKVVATGAGSDVSEKFYDIPLTLGAEAAATSWLKVRGSIQHSLFGQASSFTGTSTTKNSLDGLSSVAAGLGFNFGDLSIDGLLAASVGSAPSVNSVTATQMGNFVNSTAAFGFGSMLTRVSLTYNF